MKFKYIVVYQIRGLTCSPNENDTVIDSKERTGHVVKSIITSNPDPYCNDLDRSLALGYLMLKSFVGQRETDDVNREITGIQEARKKDLEGSLALIFIAEGDIVPDFSRPHRETADYVVGFDIINKEEIVSTYRDHINATIAALCLSLVGKSIQVKRLRSDVYLINEHDLPVYSMEFSDSGEMFSSTPITKDIIEDTQVQLKKSNKRALTKVNKLLTQAISRENDELRRFMFGWAGLEILITSVFKEYEKLFAQSLPGAELTSPTHRYFRRIREVMKGKYNIADQFVIVAACIGNEAVEADIEEFVRIKKIRDALFHDTSAAEKGLPSFEAIELLKKYLRLHTRKAAG